MEIEISRAYIWFFVVHRTTNLVPFTFIVNFEQRPQADEIPTITDYTSALIAQTSWHALSSDSTAIRFVNIHHTSFNVGCISVTKHKSHNQKKTKQYFKGCLLHVQAQKSTDSASIYLFIFSQTNPYVYSIMCMYVCTCVHMYSHMNQSKCAIDCVIHFAHLSKIVIGFFHCYKIVNSLNSLF